MKLAFMILTLALLGSCSEAAFQQQGNRKNPSNPGAGEANPALPSSGNPVDCTGMSEKDCHDKKEDMQSQQSFRTVDCSNKTASDCANAITQAKIQDGKENSEIRVINCNNDATSLCAKGPAADCTGISQDLCKKAKLDQKTDESYRVVDCQQKNAIACEDAVRQAIKTDGDEGSEIRIENCKEDAAGSCSQLQKNANERDIDLGTGTSTTTSQGIIGNGDSVTLSSLKYCAGGPMNAVYAFATQEEAQSCFQKVKMPGAFNNSANCAKCARVGRCSFKGTAEEARKTVRRLIAADCDCLTMNKASIPGISWDSYQAPCQ